MGPPAAHLCGTDCYIWRVTPRFLLGANLSEEPECPPYCNPHQVVVGKVTLANQVPPVVLPTGTLEESAHGPWKDWILGELSLQGLEEWPKE